MDELVRCCGGRWLETPRLEGVFTRITTDSRDVRPGDLFFALPGENFDAHDYAREAASQGARGIVVSRPVDAGTAGAGVLLVDDTLHALGQLAQRWKQRFNELRTVSIVGSSGKTTAKEMLGDIVSLWKPSLVTQGNLNNLIGLPQTIFRLTPQHEVAILELGMNVPGENARLTEIARPDCILLTNITHAHIGMFEDEEAHYRAEAEPLLAARTDAHLILNRDDPKSRQAYLEFGDNRSAWWFSVREPADFFITGLVGEAPYGYSFILQTPLAAFPVTLTLYGRHNISNAVAAAAAATWLGVPPELIEKGLTEFRPRLNRSEVETVEGITLLKDYYNAIPHAVTLVLDSMKDIQTTGKRYAVLADMLELGEHEMEMHESVGRHCAKTGLDGVFTYGERARAISREAERHGAAVRHFEDLEEMAEFLLTLLEKNDVLLIKGSRGMKLENLYEKLKPRLELKTR